MNTLPPAAAAPAQIRPTGPAVSPVRFRMIPTVFAAVWLLVLAYAGYRSGITLLPRIPVRMFEPEQFYMDEQAYSPVTAVIRMRDQPRINATIRIVGYSTVRSIPENIGELTEAESLYIFGQPMTELPDTVGRMTSLESVIIMNTPIKKLPESIGNLTNLRVLTVVGTDISALPESIGNLENLESLNLSHNKLASLPRSIANLKKLSILSLTGNRLRSLPIPFVPAGDISVYIGDNPGTYAIADHSYFWRFPFYY